MRARVSTRELLSEFPICVRVCTHTCKCISNALFSESVHVGPCSSERSDGGMIVLQSVIEHFKMNLYVSPQVDIEPCVFQWYRAKLFEALFVYMCVCICVDSRMRMRPWYWSKECVLYYERRRWAPSVIELSTLNLDALQLVLLKLEIGRCMLLNHGATDTDGESRGKEMEG